MSNYNSNPNQRHVKICKEQYMKKAGDGGLTYGKISIKGSQYAMKDLTPAEFQVWFYFAKNEKDYDFWVSPAAALEEFGIKKWTFQQAVLTLIEKGYLVQRENKSNEFDFYEVPPKDLEGFVVCNKSDESTFTF